MGRLTEDMTRLAAEINVERGERGRLIRDMKSSTKDMKHAVAHMMGSFHSAQAQMAREQRRNLRGFVSSLHNTVLALRTECAHDLAGARAAFFGTATAASGRGHARRAKSFGGDAA